jgi:hypothetical protein
MTFLIKITYHNANRISCFLSKSEASSKQIYCTLRLLRNNVPVIKPNKEVLIWVTTPRISMRCYYDQHSFHLFLLILKPSQYYKHMRRMMCTIYVYLGFRPVARVISIANFLNIGDVLGSSSHLSLVLVHVTCYGFLTSGQSSFRNFPSLTHANHKLPRCSLIFIFLT